MATQTNKITLPVPCTAVIHALRAVGFAIPNPGDPGVSDLSAEIKDADLVVSWRLERANP